MGRPAAAGVRHRRPHPWTLWRSAPGDRLHQRATNWQHEAFQALNFDLTDPSYFHYFYTSEGTERGSLFTAHAFGNLDCDDEWSTYERAGSVDERFNVVGGGLYINNDIE